MPSDTFFRTVLHDKIIISVDKSTCSMKMAAKLMQNDTVDILCSKALLIIFQRRKRR